MSTRTLVPVVLTSLAVQAAQAAQTSDPLASTAKQAGALKDKIIDFVLLHGPALLGAVVMLMAGVFAAKWVGKIIERGLEKKQLEPPLRMLIGRIVRLLVVALAAVMALGTVGFNVTALIAGISVAGVGVGLAMQGVLGNLVAGLVIIFTKPFRVGEYIALIGVEGQVQHVELFSTTLTHPDRSRVVIPNRKIVGEVLHNYGAIRQLDLVVGVAYRTDLTAALSVINTVLQQSTRVLKDPAPAVGIAMLADSSINIAVKPWTNLADYGPARAELYQAIVERFRERNIEIPFPQREVRMLNG
jgi:small conductance mechanosensitive channel